MSPKLRASHIVSQLADYEQLVAALPEDEGAAPKYFLRRQKLFIVTRDHPCSAAEYLSCFEKELPPTTTYHIEPVAIAAGLGSGTTVLASGLANGMGLVAADAASFIVPPLLFGGLLAALAYIGADAYYSQPANTCHALLTSLHREVSTWGSDQLIDFSDAKEISSEL